MPFDPSVSKAAVGAAGMYYVAYHLSLRNLIVSPTLGNTPGVALRVCDPQSGAIASVQVKARRANVTLSPESRLAWAVGLFLWVGGLLAAIFIWPDSPPLISDVLLSVLPSAVALLAGQTRAVGPLGGFLFGWVVSWLGVLIVFAIPDATDIATCPYCAEKIKAAAVVCKHCGRSLERMPDHEASNRLPPRGRNRGRP